MKTFLGGFVAIAVLVTAAPSMAVTTLWDFGGDLTATSGYDVMAFRDAASESAASFGVSDGTTVPLMNGQPVTYMSFPAWGAETGLGIDRPFRQLPSNTWTIGWDLCVPQSSFDDYSYMGLFNTNPDNVNDAELYVDLRENVEGNDPTYGGLFVDRDSDNGKVWVQGGAVQPDTWHRIVLAYDLNHPTEDIRVFVDGVKVGAGDADFGDASLAVHDYIPFLTENNYETSPGFIAAAAFSTESLDDATITALGGPSVDGFAAIANPGDGPMPPDVPPGSSRYADAVKALNPDAYFRLNEAAGAEVGTPLVNEGAVHLPDATWGLPGYPLTGPTSGVEGPIPWHQINGQHLSGLEDENTAAHFRPIEGKDGADMLNLGSNPSALDQENVTWSMLFKTTQSTEYTRVMVTPPSFENPFFLIMGSNGKVQLCTNKQDPEAGMYDYAQAILGVNDGLWHHLVAVRNGDDMADAELYIDGVKIDLTPLRSSGGWSDSFSFRIGTRGSGSGNFIGHLDEIAIWNRSLTEQEAMQLFQAVVPEPGTFALLLGALFAGVLRRGRK